MGRKLFALLIVLLVASCGSRDSTAPRNLDDACSILSERPHYRRAFRKVERRWGVPTNVLMAVMHQESKFIGNARTPHKYMLGIIPMGRQSSAYGYSQALDSTWDDYREQTRSRRARRTDIDDAADFMGWYMAGSTKRLGIPLTDARNQYLAYHEGRTGYLRGSHNNKSWLLSVAQRVAVRSALYGKQLPYCR
ncbi:lytic transglycosylase [Pseudooceanicola sediminis]|uniref:Lytic transglycosylase n=1 Tax=Pseudooceanicola sediminis TaxID=2211117 RepID=A0A399J354_9RHOB|nr:transglycosylase SLT domain-containing protein [Pseudooceanicola sediminis]KAA2313388.1 transglycosylase SLT domain-containing protein [Puniceibacterium sp. HSS470]RII38332.1 lytic transglycosylase [Pseudooceanicola sediminis]|tara:strand:- start:45746 stop:46324 length:579 start_codon:yes stop_codon:yes gene_type:complete